MSFVYKVKNKLRPFRDVLYIFFGYGYDLYRYFRFAGWSYGRRDSVKDYKAVKIYHRLEKSLSFRARESGSGWGAAVDLVNHLEKSLAVSSELTYHEKVGLKVLGDFIAVSSTQNINEAKAVIDFWRSHNAHASLDGGIIATQADFLQSGRLENPEGFFSSRFSVRDFHHRSISNEEIERALTLALNTPSVCNRQASYVYCLNDRDEIDKALSLQNGNRGFGHEIPYLLILCADLSAFDTAGERYQHWIDGGMFSMSVIWALHSLGLASCCLNWSKGALDDLKFRKLINIKNEHTVLMMLAVGEPKEDLKVCYSARKPVADFYKVLG